MKIKPVMSDIEVGKESFHENIIDIIIANGQYYGKGIHALPDSWKSFRALWQDSIEKELALIVSPSISTMQLIFRFPFQILL